MPYKQVFASVFTDDVLSDRSLDEMFALLPDGHLRLQFSETPQLVDLGVHSPVSSTIVLSGDEPGDNASTPDKRYYVQIESYEHMGAAEHWLIHTDHASGKFKRAKLTSEYPVDEEGGPRVAVSPGGTFFLADDSGTVRLYSTEHLIDAGAFQMAHAKTENRIIALAVSADDRLVVGLSSWKDIVLYNVPDRRVAFVRQIRDEVGWYESEPASIMLAGNAEAIVTLGAGHTGQQSVQRLSVNAFRFVPLHVA